MNKLLLPLGSSTVFEHCLKVLLRSAIQEVVVVLSPLSGELAEKLKGLPSGEKERVRIVTNTRFKQGVSRSIAEGIRSLSKSSQGVLICLGDQPLLKRSTIDALLRAFQRGKGKIVVPVYGGQRGNPVLFDRRYLNELMKLKGDRGGKSIVDRNPDKVCRVRTRSRAVLRDMDTWEEYRRIRSEQDGKGKNRRILSEERGKGIDEIREKAE